MPRGYISVAVSLRPTLLREQLVSSSYVVAMFSILGQVLTVGL